MKVNLVLDSRESDLKKELSSLGVDISIEQLPVGDVLFKDCSTGEVLLICERKTKSDLYSSIIDKRFPEQRERAKAAAFTSGAKVVYIIEKYVAGSSSPYSSSVADDAKKNKILSGALENLLLRGMYILPTHSVKHTAATLCNLQKKLESEEYTKKHALEEKSCVEVVPALFTKKKDVISANMFQHQLMLIPGVSLDISRVIIQKYSSVREIIKAYDVCVTEEAKQEMLQDIPLGKRRLGKVLSTRIYSVYN